jgi:peroxiredoxin
MREKHRIGFPILSDAGNAYAGSMSLVYEYPEDLQEIYRGFGIRMAEFNGDDSWTLPLATRMVVGTDGVIRSIDADPDYTIRPEIDATLAVLSGLRGSSDPSPPRYRTENA